MFIASASSRDQRGEGVMIQDRVERLVARQRPALLAEELQTKSDATSGTRPEEVMIRQPKRPMEG